MYYCGQCPICKSVVASCEPNFLLLFLLLFLFCYRCPTSPVRSVLTEHDSRIQLVSVAFSSILLPVRPSCSFVMPPRRARGSCSTPYQTRSARDRRARRIEEEQTSDPPNVANLAEVSSVGELSLQQFVALVGQVVRANRETPDLTGAGTPTIADPPTVSSAQLPISSADPLPLSTGM